MRKHGILNAQLAGLLARLGHTDTVVVADCGLPVPAGVPVVDLALVFGVPRFDDVFTALLAEIEVEGVTVADQAPQMVHDLIPEGVEMIAEIDHEDLKEMVAGAAFVVRTGETTPYANAILHCGVPF
ncbi:D-ribose pyranase [Corynebacterium sp.]|uniref:D-ribose pyranase n=1 Tax=Corynebacterium sp. TaxID=1720 RepID=UPI003735968C